MNYNLYVFLIFILKMVKVTTYLQICIIKLNKDAFIIDETERIYHNHHFAVSVHRIDLLFISILPSL